MTLTVESSEVEEFPRRGEVLYHPPFFVLGWRKEDLEQLAAERGKLASYPLRAWPPSSDAGVP